MKRVYGNRRRRCHYEWVDVDQRERVSVAGDDLDVPEELSRRRLRTRLALLAVLILAVGIQAVAPSRARWRLRAESASGDAFITSMPCEPLTWRSTKPGRM